MPTAARPMGCPYCAIAASLPGAACVRHGASGDSYGGSTRGRVGHGDRRRSRRRGARTVVARATLALTLALALMVTAGVPSRAENEEAAAPDQGEVWATGEAGGVVYVLGGMGSVKPISAPTMSRPHIVTFSPSGNYAYVSDVGNGKLNVVQSADRAVVKAIEFSSGGGDTHQAKPSPDGRILLVTRRGTAKTLHKVRVDEASASWAVADEKLDFGALGYTPVCSVFRADGQRAYVSVTSVSASPPNGIAVVDVDSMTLVGGVEGILPTQGAVACGMAESRHGDGAYVVSNGGAGHLYLLARSTGHLAEISFPSGIGADDLHYAALSANEEIVYASSRGNDQLKMLLHDSGTEATIALDPTPGVLDRPDGVAVKGEKVYVAIKDAGKLAIVRPNQGKVTYLDVAPARSNALSHVTVRP